MDAKKICVFCSSSDAIDPIFYNHAKLLGMEIAKRSMDLIFGGSNVGLMREVTEAVIAGGGKVIGVIPTFIKEKKGIVDGMTEVIETQNMFDRKQKMIELSDTFIMLPGGIGTLDEALDVIVLKQFGQVKGPIIFINTNGYYEPFRQVLLNMVEHKFLKPFDDNYILFTDNIDGIWDYIEAYEFKFPGDKWF